MGRILREDHIDDEGRSTSMETTVKTRRKIFLKKIFSLLPNIFSPLESENQGRSRYGRHFIAPLDKGGFSGPKYHFKSKIHSAHFEINISSHFFKGQKFDFGEKWK